MKLIQETLFEEHSETAFESQIRTIENVGNVEYRIGEFWTAKQRQANSLHEVSYRACFKPQLPNFFIENFTKEGDLVFDPFGGRGTTGIQAAIRGRKVGQNDINPLSKILAKPRLNPPTLEQVKTRLDEIHFNSELESEIDLSMFFETKTLNEILNYKNRYLLLVETKSNDFIDDWIQMVATNRLTGHSSGFFSVYSFPPNQAVSAKRQTKINADRQQVPEYRDTKSIILKKSRGLLKDLDAETISNLRIASKSSKYFNQSAETTFELKENSVSLTVTSPPFLDVVQYADDNWLRCWFNGIDASEIGKNITVPKDLETWSRVMKNALIELYRITKEGGIVAFEVGEVKNGKIKLEEAILPIGIEIGFKLEYVMLNEQFFTKTSNLWGVSNNSKGTNTNRIVVFRK